MYSGIGHEPGHFFESVGHGQPAVASELHVPGQSEISTTLYVERHQIETVPFSRLFDQIVGHFLRDRVVHGLGDLIHEAHQVFVNGACSVQIERPADQIRQFFGS